MTLHREGELLAVYVGRFQPPHQAHLSTALAALQLFPRLLILLGSANLARSSRNPFTASERRGLWQAALRDAGVDLTRVIFRPLADQFEAGRWAASVQAEALSVGGPHAHTVLVGHEKDASSAYLRWFPGWERWPAPEVAGVNATNLRSALFENRPLPDGVPHAVWGWLDRVRPSPTLARLRREWQALQAQQATLEPGLRLYEQRWVHVQAGQVWLEHRAGPVAQGLWSLPGQVLPPGTPPPPGTLTFGHPARALVGEAVAQIYAGLPPSGTPARPVALTLALTRPRLFAEDHHVILSRWLERP